MSEELVQELRRLGSEAGASTVGVASTQIFGRELDTLISHRASGLSGPLRFTYSDPATATDVTRTFPWAKSIVVVGVNYLPASLSPAASGPVIGRFATKNHYLLLERVAGEIREKLRAENLRAEVLIDDNRLVDRAPAVRAGIGWRGKSTMVLAPGDGPWTLLGSIVTDAALEPTPPMRRDCGTCVACFPACPTNALSESGLDARRCLSTWLQTGGSLPLWIRPRLGRRIYGCDDCLTACPPGHKTLVSFPGISSDITFNELLEIDDHQLLQRFSWWYVPRRDGRFIRRNLLVAAGNSGEGQAVRAIRDHLDHRSSMIRSHAAWALARAIGDAGKETLFHALASETVAEAREEIELALTMVQRPAEYEEVLRLDEERAMSQARRR